MTVPPSGTPAWYVRERGLPNRQWEVRCIIDPSQRDGDVFEEPFVTQGMFEHWHVTLDASGRPVVSINVEEVPGIPSIWFVDVRQQIGALEVQSLVAFATSHFPRGTVIQDSEFFGLPIKSREQIGAVRWWSDRGVIDQVFVAESWRRRGIGSLLLFSADAYHQFRGLPGAIRSDGRRTAMGEGLVASLRFPERIAPLDEIMPPMDER